MLQLITLILKHIHEFLTKYGLEIIEIILALYKKL
jgi:hypothetical protein